MAGSTHDVIKHQLAMRRIAESSTSAIGLGYGAGTTSVAKPGRNFMQPFVAGWRLFHRLGQLRRERLVFQSLCHAGEATSRNGVPRVNDSDYHRPSDLCDRELDIPSRVLSDGH